MGATFSGLAWTDQDTRRRKRLTAAMNRWHKDNAVASCLFEDGSCAGPIVRAHTVQNKGGLDVLARDGHVYMLGQDPSEPRSRFELVGRNKATTFTGFCNRHDTSVFREIDRPWNCDLAERLIVLHSMRAAAREYWAKLNVIKSFTQVLSYYRSGQIEKLAEHFGLDQSEIPTDPGMIDFWRDALASYSSGARRIGARFASLRSQVESGEYHLTVSHVHVFEGRPSVGAATWSSPEYDFHARRVVSLTPTGHLPDLAVCVLPEPGRTVVLLAYHRQDRRVLDVLPLQLRRMSKSDCRMALSWYLVIHGENVVYSSDYVDSLGTELRERIEDVFFQTIDSAMPYAGLPPINFFG